MRTQSRLHPAAQALAESGYPVDDLYGAGAWVYDLLTRDDPHELAELVRLARPATRAIVEIGAGSGRITLPLLKAGHDVVAIDTSTEMLELLEATVSSKRLAGELVPVLHRPGQPYRFDSTDLVVCGTTTITALSAEDRLGLFSRCGEGLTEGGRVVFSTMEIAPNAPLVSSQVVVAQDSGETYLVMILEAINRARWSRTVTVVVDPVARGEHRRVYATESWILSADQLVSEAGAFGLDLVAVKELGQRQDGRQSVLIELSKGRTPR